MSDGSPPFDAWAGEWVAYAAVPHISLTQKCLKMSHMLEGSGLDTSQMAAIRELAVLGWRRPMCGAGQDHPCYARDMDVILHRRGDERAAWWLKRYLRINPDTHDIEQVEDSIESMERR